MNIEIISCLNDNYSYLIHDEHSNMVGIIDPSEFEPCDKIINNNYKKLGVHALKFSKDFSWNKIIKKYIELI